MIPSRASTVARVVPPLAQILSRAFTAGAVISAGGKYTAQNPSRNRPVFNKSRIQPASIRDVGQAASKEPSADRKPSDTSNRVQQTTSQKLALPSTERLDAFGLHDTRKNDHRTEANIMQAQARPFSAFEMHEGLQACLAEKYPDGQTMPIQSLSLLNLLGEKQSHRALLAAETGSGKTLAYLLPLLHHLKATDEGVPRGTGGDSGKASPRALVLSPTHELTRQSTLVAKSLTHRAKLSVMGGSSPGSVYGAGAIDVLFATGRSAAWLLNIPREPREGSREADFAAKKAAREEKLEGEGKDGKPERGFKREEVLDMSRLEWLVIDEADVLLGPDFADETAKVLERIQEAQPNVNILLVTATLPPSLHRMLESNPLLSAGEFEHILSPGLHRLPKRLDTRFVPWSRSGNVLAEVAHEIKRDFAEDSAAAKLENRKERSMGVLFCGSVPKVESAAAALEAKGIKCLAWTGESSTRQPGRNGPLDFFLASHKKVEGESTKGPRILVTTSLLSRGLDFSPAVSTIYLLDPPRNVLDFVHRAGRAGRAGRPGRVVVFGVKHAGQMKYGEELRSVLGKMESRVSVKPGGRTWSGKRFAQKDGGSGSGERESGSGSGSRPARPSASRPPPKRYGFRQE